METQLRRRCQSGAMLRAELRQPAHFLAPKAVWILTTYVLPISDFRILRLISGSEIRRRRISNPCRLFLRRRPLIQCHLLPTNDRSCLRRRSQKRHRKRLLIQSICHGSAPIQSLSSIQSDKPKLLLWTKIDPALWRCIILV